MPNGPGKEIVLRACVKCHSLKVTTSKRATEDEWATSVNTMVNRGAVLSDDEVDEVIDYLSKNFKPVELEREAAGCFAAKVICAQCVRGPNGMRSILGCGPNEY